MDYRDYYGILGVPRTATPAEIKKAFRKLAREHHPDRNPGDAAAEKRFKDVNEAHAVLSDPDKRKQYDLLGANWEQYQRAGGAGFAPGADPFGPGGPFAGFAGFGGTGTGGRAGNVRYEFRTAGEGGFSDFFRMFFSGAAAGAAAGTTAAGVGARGRVPGRGTGGTTGTAPGIEDLFSGMDLDEAMAGGQRAGRGAGSRSRGRPAVEAPAELSLEEAYHGTTRVVDVDGRRFEVRIPRGVDTGSRVRLSGKGPEGSDVVVAVRVRQHDVYTRRGADLERELPITLREALLGAEVRVATLKGRILLTIPPGTQNGRTFRLTGQGMPRMKGDGTGDLYLRVRVVLPTGLSDEARAAAARFLDLAGQPDPRADG